MKQILCFGDSNTYGLIPKTTKRYDWGERWTSILQERVGKYGYRIVEEGLCGRTTVFEDRTRVGRRGDKILPVLLESHGPLDTIVLMLGTNDCKTYYNASPEQIGEGLQVLLKQIAEFAPESKVLIISPIFLGEQVWKTEFDPEFSKHSVTVSQKLGDVYEKIAEQWGHSFLRAADYAVCSEVDQEHLNQEGHRKLADAVFEKLTLEVLRWVS